MKKLISISVLVLIFILFTYSENVYEKVLEGNFEGEEMKGFYLGGLFLSKPALADLDNDGDLDLFIGNTLHYNPLFINEGNASEFNWILADTNFLSISESNISPYFVDIDNDNDYDLFYSKSAHTDIVYYKNNGSPSAYSFNYITDTAMGISPSEVIESPSFSDIDGDGDYDCFISYISIPKTIYVKNNGTSETASFAMETDGLFSGIRGETFFCDIDGNGTQDTFIGFTTYLFYYRNDGTINTPSWTLVTDKYVPYSEISSSPEFHDLDGDADLDLLMGTSYGVLLYYENEGNTTTASFTTAETIMLTMDTGNYSMPSFSDIDNDNDYDLFIGNSTGKIFFCRNDGTNEIPDWTIVSKNYEGIDVGTYSIPVFVDIDNDNDFDMFIGEGDGYINFYQNNGTVSSPAWTFITATYESIDVGDRSTPAFSDIDNDGDYDLFIGNSAGDLYFYRNDGTASSPSWTFITQNYNGFDYSHTKPYFTDIDNDGDPDLFLDSFNNLYFFRNTGTPETAAWTLITDDF
ncbi:MAG: VCBS repeat-containing protein, partial [bacterium]|nr:VCBS repeat-containing protein [bacterium]